MFAQDGGEHRPHVPQETLSGHVVGERRKLQEVPDYVVERLVQGCGAAERLPCARGPEDGLYTSRVHESGLAG